jgi:hypothetical protein
VNKKYLLALALGVVLVGGCAPQDRTESDREQQSYEDLDELRQAIEDAGHECDQYRVVEDPILALHRAECSRGVSLVIHQDTEQAQESINDVADHVNAAGEVSVHLIGPNWSVNCGQEVELCTQLQNGGVGGGVIERAPDA